MFLLLCRETMIIRETRCFRHVILSAHLGKLVPKSHLMTETEWRNLGVQQSPGWVHYMMHGPGKIVSHFEMAIGAKHRMTSCSFQSRTSSSSADRGRTIRYRRPFRRSCPIASAATETRDHHGETCKFELGMYKRACM